jgi:hypothetical protein
MAHHTAADAPPPEEAPLPARPALPGGPGGGPGPGPPPPRRSGAGFDRLTSGPGALPLGWNARSAVLEGANAGGLAP